MWLNETVGDRREARGVGSIVRTQHIVVRIDEAGGVVEHEFQLLRQTAADDRVVLVETHFERFTREKLFVHELADKILQFLPGRRAEPLIARGLNDPSDLAFTDRHRLHARDLDGIPIDPAIGREQDRAGGDEMQEGFSEEVHRSFPLHASAPLFRSNPAIRRPPAERR